MVAWIALGVSSLSLFWQLIYALRVDRATLKVGVAAMTAIPGNKQFFVITVTNIGRRATVLQSAHLTLGKPRRVRDRLPRWLGGKRPYAMLAFADSDMPLINTAKFPHKLDTGDEAAVYIQRHHVVNALGERGEHWIHVRAAASNAKARTSPAVRVDLPG